MLRQLIEEQYKLINLSVIKKVKDKQKILLYLKYDSDTINFDAFPSIYDVKYRSHVNSINKLLEDKIIKTLNKKSRHQSYKLIIKPEDIIIFENATEQEHYLVYQYLKTQSSPKDLEDYVSIILNPKALKLLHELKDSESRTFHFSKKTKPLNHLIKYDAVKKLATKIYTLKENYNEELYKLEQHKLLKDKQIIFSQDSNPNDIIILNWIIENAVWQESHNIHNLELAIKVNGLYQDISSNPFYDPIKTNNGQIPVIENLKIEDHTFVNAFVHKSDILGIIIGCSQNPILVSDNRRLNMILAEVFHELNKISPISRQLGYDYYECDYDNFIISKHDFAIDGNIPYKLPKGFEIPFTNQNGEDLILYVKKSFKNHSWIRIEDRADKKKKTSYTLPAFRVMIQNRILNLIPRHER